MQLNLGCPGKTIKKGNMDEIAVKRQKVEVKVEPESVDHSGSPHANSAKNVGAGQPTVQSPSSNGAATPPPLPQQAYWPGALLAPATEAPASNIVAFGGDRDLSRLCRPANGLLARWRTSRERLGPSSRLGLAFPLSASSDLPSKSAAHGESTYHS